MHEGGLDQLGKWLAAHPNRSIVGIDVMALFKPRSNRKKDAYEEAYEVLTPLRKLAIDYGVSIVVVDHTRKGVIAANEDPLDAIMGSGGKPAAADGVILFYRKRGEHDARLLVVTRYEDDTEVLLTTGSDGISWIVKAESDDIAVVAAPEQRKVLRIVRKHPDGIELNDLAAALRKNPNTTRSLLRVLRDKGMIEFINNKYLPTLIPPNRTNNPNQERDNSHGLVGSIRVGADVLITSQSSLWTGLNGHRD